MASSGKLQPPYILLSYFSLQQNNGKLKFPLPFIFLFFILYLFILTKHSTTWDCRKGTNHNAFVFIFSRMISQSRLMTIALIRVSLFLSLMFHVFGILSIIFLTNRPLGKGLIGHVFEKRNDFTLFGEGELALH